jgi:hypothetical protein
MLILYNREAAKRQKCDREQFGDFEKRFRLGECKIAIAENMPSIAVFVANTDREKRNYNVGGSN